MTEQEIATSNGEAQNEPSPEASGSEGEADVEETNADPLRARLWTGAVDAYGRLNDRLGATLSKYGGWIFDPETFSARMRGAQLFGAVIGFAGIITATAISIYAGWLSRYVAVMLIFSWMGLALYELCGELEAKFDTPPLPAVFVTGAVLMMTWLYGLSTIIGTLLAEQAIVHASTMLRAATVAGVWLVIASAIGPGVGLIVRYLDVKIELE
jgi:hypothetical protein